MGDPQAEGLAAVLLCLNPGIALPAQRLPDGALIAAVRRYGYRHVAAHWLFPEETRAWWARRAAWATRLAGRPQVLESIVGMDLLPWHSERFGSLLLHDRVVGGPAIEWLRREVVGPAVATASGTALSRIVDCPRRRPILLALDAQVRVALEHAGWARLAHLDRYDGPRHHRTWPLDGTGARVDRTFSVLLQQEAPWAVAIVIDAKDLLLEPPSAAFDPLILRLIREHGCPCAAAHTKRAPVRSVSGSSGPAPAGSIDSNPVKPAAGR